MQGWISGVGHEIFENQDTMKHQGLFVMYRILENKQEGRRKKLSLDEMWGD